MSRQREREEDEQMLDEDLDDSLDNPALESELNDDLIEEWCPICRDVKPHAVVKGDRIACAECNHEHLREVEAPNMPIKQTVLSDEDRASDEALKSAWERLTSDMDEESLQSYSIRLKLSDGDVIRHSKFGVGIVVEMTDTTKAEVLFLDGLRRLVCGK